MSNVYEATKPTEETSPTASKSNCGCWVAGCLTIVLAGLLAVGVLMYFLVRFTNAQIEKYSDDKPQNLPVVEYDEESLTALDNRMEDFRKALLDDQDTEDLVLTADDLNALISREEKLKGKVFVEIEEGQIKGDISMPLDALPLGVGKGRYFNASATFEVTVANGILIVTLDSATVKGEPVPEEFMEQLRRENLAKDVKFEGDTSKVLRRIKEVVVEEGKVVLKVKPVDSEKSDQQPAGQEPDAEVPNDATTDSEQVSGDEIPDNDVPAGDATVPN